MSLPDRIAAIRRDYDHCFGCGASNPIGLNLTDFERSDNTVRATFEPRRDFHGFSDLLHGGIVATALDEIMAWTAILVEGVMVMTGKLDLRYRKPAKVDRSFVLVGQLLERRGRRLQISAQIFDGDVVVAEASGLFLAIEDLADSD
ncbi:MAG: PaaI family thioesterase [Acidimicrobiia bacterium]|nr:PaaI family thioesterase [Acidimicrobiia bacterium]MDX2468403.1 PaaI family thioesterase [Acidimicrobiia bacterium]